jgi:hypothetical protein
MNCQPNNIHLQGKTHKLMNCLLLWHWKKYLQDNQQL